MNVDPRATQSAASMRGDSGGPRIRAVANREPERRHERLRRYLEARDAALRSQLEPGEAVVAAGPHALLTDHRIIFTAVFPGERVGGREDVRDSLGFDAIIRWAVGRRHDHRPVLRLEHAPHTRIERIPAHRVLWFRWGNATGPVVYRETTLPFNRDRDPEFRAVVDRLRADDVPAGAPFEVLLPGTREQRRRGRVTLGVQYAGPASWLHNPGGRLRAWEGELYSGNNLAWRVRLISWLLLAIPAWFVSPWLVLPAIVLAEIAWIVALRRVAHRDRRLNPSR